MSFSFAPSSGRGPVRSGVSAPLPSSSSSSPPSSAFDTTPPSSAASNIMRVPHTNQTGLVIVRIEQILESVLNNLSRATELTIPFCRRPTRLRDRTSSSEHGQRCHSSSDTAQTAGMSRDSVSFPGRSDAESKLFSMHCLLLQVLGCVDTLTCHLDSTGSQHSATVSSGPSLWYLGYEEVCMHAPPFLPASNSYND